MPRRVLTAVLAVTLFLAVHDSHAAAAPVATPDSAVTAPDSADAPAAGDVRHRLSAPT